MIRKTLIAGALAFCCLVVPVHAEKAPPPPPANTASLEGMVGPAIYVSDPARSLKFYTDGLGMVLRMRFGPPDRPDMVVGFGPDPLQAGIMLITDKAGLKQRLIEHAHGFDRIALRVADIRTIADHLRTAGFEPGEIRIVHGTVQMMMVNDPDGYKIELIDSKPAPRQPM